MTGYPLIGSLAPGFALIGPVGWSELLIILFLVLLFFGPKRLPELAESLGKSIQRFKKATREIKDDVESDRPEKPSVTEGKDKQG